MKGTLHKTESGWQVWYHVKDELYHGSIRVRILPLHPDDTIGIGQENLDIEFEIFDNREICNCACHKNPDITHFIACCNNGYKTDNLGHVNYYAKIADQWVTMKEGDITVNFKPMPEFDEPEYPTRAEQLREQGWLEIDKAFSKYWTEYTDGDFSHFTAVEKAQRKIGWLKENYNPPTKKEDHDK